MKFLPYQLIAEANGWLDSTPRAERAAVRRFEAAVKAYELHLDRIRPRLSASAWRFFRYGVQEKGLHDATLLDFRVGDDLHGSGERDYLWYRNRAVTHARLVFLNLEGTYTRVFDCRGVRRLRADFFACEPLKRNLGDLYAYEVRAVDRNWLALGAVFASGAELEIEFRRLVFRSRSQKAKTTKTRQYQVVRIGCR